MSTSDDGSSLVTTWPGAPVTDPASLRALYSCFPSGVVAVCGRGPAGPVGLAASSFTSVSLDPPLVSLCVQDTSATWPRLAALPRLGVSVLGATQTVACQQLAARTGDRFAGLPLTASADGAVFVEGSSAQLECSVTDVVPAGDHRIVLLAVNAARYLVTEEPLVFHGSRFRGLTAPAA